MADYLGNIHALFHKFNELLPLVSTHAQELEQRSKFFVVLTLLINSMVVREQLEQLQQIEDDDHDHVRYDTGQFCNQACDNVTIVCPLPSLRG